MIINLGIEPERVAAYKKQYSILFLAARAERPKRGQSVCKAQSAAADGEPHHKLHFCLKYLPTAQLAALAALHRSGHLRILPQLCCVCTANRQAVPFSHSRQFPRKEQVVGSIPIASSRKRRYHQISLFFMIINLGIGPERVAAYKKQYGILFLAARAERPKRGQSVCKAQSAAADGDSHRKLHFYLQYLPTCS